MATHIPVHDKGLTVLYEAPRAVVDLVFVHGFTGHPKDTWALKGAKSQLATRVKKHSRDDELITGPAGHSKIRKLLSHARLGSSPGPPAATRPIPSSCLAPLTDPEDASGTNRDDSDVYWPVDLACKTLPNSRILTYGYDTKVRHLFAGPVSQNSVYDHAGDLLGRLESLRRSSDEACRPILFIAHSLGGIVVKEALRISRGCENTIADRRRIYESTSGIMFFGTPHGGADPRNLIHHVLSALVRAFGLRVNNQIVNTLMPDAEHLTQLRDEFSIMCQERIWKVHSFQEEYGVPALFGNKVVNDNSSCLNNPTLETKQHISSNHMDMCRFSGLQDQEYLKVAAAMTHIVGATGNGGVHGGMGHEQPLALRVRKDALPPPDKTHTSPPSPIAEEEPRVAHPPQATPLATEEPPTGVGYGIPDDVKQALVEQLYFAKIDERLTSLAAAQGTTCRWFLSKQEYTSWRDPAQLVDHGGFLWIKGNPGTGKSTLMKLLFEEAKRGARSDPSQILLSFFFLARGTAEEKTTTGLYRSLLHQLFEKAAHLKDGMEWMTSDGARGIQATGWHEEALKRTLAEAVRKLGDRSLTIFVDALDECDDTQAEGMVSFCEELCVIAQEIGAQLHICFSSRHYPHIEINGIEIILEDEVGHLEDIKQYIRSRLRLRKSKAAESLQLEIVEKSSLIFLWVVLVVDILNRDFPLKPISEIGKRLKEIPRGLSDLFEMILTRDGQNPELLRLSLQWVLFATCPLKPQELYFAVQFGLDAEMTGSWDQEGLGLDHLRTFVISSSKGLAEVTRKASEVQFIHESVRDFLLGKYGTQWSGVSGNYAGHGHQALRDCCLAQLNATANQNVGILNTEETPTVASTTALSREAVCLQYPFLKYSVHNVLRHANDTQKHGMDQATFLHDFPLRRWITLHNTLEMYPIRRHKDEISLSYILAEANLAELIHVLPLETESCFDAGAGRYGPPILAAMVSGAGEAVRALLEAHARVHSLDSQTALRGWCKQYPRQKGTRLSRSFVFSDRKTRSFMYYALEYGDAALLHYVLQHVPSAWTKLDLLGINGRTPLLHVIQGGHIDIVRRLLELGADIKSKSHMNLTLLHHAVRGGQYTMVELLLEKGADAEQFDEDGNMPLSIAVERGRKDLAELLLKHVKSVDLKGPGGRTPLAQTATLQGRDVIAKLLLEKGANINSRDNLGQTPLSLAAQRECCIYVFDLLLKNGAEVDSRDKEGRTLLSRTVEGPKVVSRSEREQLLDENVDIKSWGGVITERLLENGADPESKDNYGRTPLSRAAETGRIEPIAILLEKGAKIESRDNDGRTPLSWATENRFEESLKCLLEKGSEIESRDNDGRTPLSWAAKLIDSFCKPLMYLLEKGADVESRDNNGRTPLSWAAENPFKVGPLKLLLEKGADIESRDNNGRTPLSWAAENPFTVGPLKLLLEKGADVESRDNNGRTPLSWVAEKSYRSEPLELLLEKGSEVESRDNNGRTPLSWATEAIHYFPKPLELLLEKGADIESRDNNGRTPVEYARRSNKTSFVYILETYRINQVPSRG